MERFLLSGKTPLRLSFNNYSGVCSFPSEKQAFISNPIVIMTGRNWYDISKKCAGQDLDCYPEMSQVGSDLKLMVRMLNRLD